MEKRAPTASGGFDGDEKQNQNRGRLTDLLCKVVSHALMETMYMRCKRLHQRIVMALIEIMKRRKQNDRDKF